MIQGGCRIFNQLLLCKGLQPTIYAEFTSARRQNSEVFAGSGHASELTWLTTAVQMSTTLYSGHWSSKDTWLRILVLSSLLHADNIHGLGLTNLVSIYNYKMLGRFSKLVVLEQIKSWFS